MSEIITTYEPDNSLKKGYFGLIREIFREIRDNYLTETRVTVRI